MPRPKGTKKDKIRPSHTVDISPSPISTSLSLQSAPSNELTFDDTNCSKTNSPSPNKGGRPKKNDLMVTSEESMTPTGPPSSSSSELRTGENGGSRVVVNPAVLRYLEQNRNYPKEVTKGNNNIGNDELSETTTTTSMDMTENNAFADLLKSLAAQESIKTDSPSEPENNPVIVKPLVVPVVSPLTSRRIPAASELIELDKLVQDDLFWDFCSCSTDFITSARLAEWILAHRSSTQLETMSVSE